MAGAGLEPATFGFENQSLFVRISLSTLYASPFPFLYLHFLRLWTLISTLESISSWLPPTSTPYPEATTREDTQNHRWPT